ncbi:hypothetical protein JTE90_018168 [Oedothorax gibbosus]|uniref:DUF4371 domain-containing protein n=1 Tax=Oedothorax gibbosus TaxID=931172 RepID=A0AAV6U9M2_9ARAC|nr:hypothetical protein JTE90_018168 [Oedothorax gibbosus]
MHPFFKQRRRIEEEATAESAPAVVNSEASTSFVLSTPEIPTEPENVSWPDVWTNEMWNEKRKLYPWLNSSNGKIGCGYCASIKNLGSLKSQGVAISKEWASTTVCCYGSDRGKKLTSLRKKIFEHLKSDAHVNAVKILESAKIQPLEKSVDRQNRSEINETCKVFRTAYFLAKPDRPYSDHFDLLELQQLNGADMAHGLRSRFSATNIIDHVAQEMKLKICKRIIEINGKISILFDESTTLSSKTTLIV